MAQGDRKLANDDDDDGDGDDDSDADDDDNGDDDDDNLILKSVMPMRVVLIKRV